MRTHLGSAVLALAAFAASTAVIATTKDRTPATPLPSVETKAAAPFGQFPVLFVENRGQADPRVAFYARGKGIDVVLTEEGIGYRLGRPGRRWTVRSDFAGAARVRPEGVTPARTTLNFFRGKKSEWKTGVRTWREVRYRDLWPGIDLALAIEGQVLEATWHVRPGADPSAIRSEWHGAAPTLAADGSLVVETPFGGFGDTAPRAWQTGGGDVAAAWRVDGTESTFDLGALDPALPLTIDPTILVSSGFVGGGGLEIGQGVAVDGSRCAYVVGRVRDTDPPPFPVKVGPDLIYAADGDAFIAKVAADGTELLYAGFIGGDGPDDTPSAVAVDSLGCAYVAGYVYDGTNFPTVGNLDNTHSDYADAFVAKVSADGSSLAYCGYIGGLGEDRAHAIAVDDAGAAYVGGWTDSFAVSFPEVGGPDLTHNGMFEGFVAKVAPDGNSLVYCGYVGGSSGDGINAIAVDPASGVVWVAGQTTSTDFPVVGGPDLTFNGPTYDAFVGKLKADFSGFEWLGYLGGAGDDKALGIAVDSSNYAHVVGATESDEATFPVTTGPDLTYNGNRDGFIAKLQDPGSFFYAGYIGGTNYDEALGVAVGPDMIPWVIGWTGYAEDTFPRTGGPDSTHNGGDQDCFVARPTWTGDRLRSCGYFGGGGQDTAYGVAVDSSNDAYVAGFCSFDEGRAPFPTVVGPDLQADGGNDAFVARFSSFEVIPVTLAKGAIKASTAALKDSLKASGTIPTAWPWDFDPATNAVRITVGDDAQPFVIDIPAGAPGWKWGKRKYAWKGAGGSLKLDLSKGKVQIAIAKVDLPEGWSNPIRVAVEVGGMIWADTRDWTGS
jgi:hypothetical protein